MKGDRMSTAESFDFQIRTKTKFGKDIFKDLPNIISDMGYKSIGIVIDSAVYRNDKVKAVIKECSDRFNSILHLYKLKGEPTYDYLDEAKKEFIEKGKSKVDCFIGIGGGSCMDFAKGLATLANNDGPAIKYRGFPTDINPSVPVIAIPTTSGTGSELAYNAVFVETKEKKKLGINTENNYPVLAILDPALTTSCQKSVTVSSGLDALVHTLESFVSKKANAMSRFYSKEAFGLIINNLKEVVDHPESIEARSAMMLGAYLAMAALSNSSSGPTGAMSYLLGAQHDVAHGIAGGVFIGKITRINHNNGYYGYAQLYDKIKGNNSGNDLSDKQKSEAVVKKIEDLLEKLEVPKHLNVFGVKDKDYDNFYKHATEIYKGAFDFNPVAISKNDIEKMLKDMIS